MKGKIEVVRMLTASSALRMEFANLSALKCLSQIPTIRSNAAGHN